MNIWHEIDKDRIKPDDFIAFIEIPKGSRKKYELDKDTGLVILDRILYTSTVYPANYGLIPLTYGGDNDPLDVLVLCSEPLDPGTLVRCKPIGMITMVDGGEMDEKIIAVAVKDPTVKDFHEITELPHHVYEQIQNFFAIYKTLEHKETQVDDEVKDSNVAKKTIADAIENYQNKLNKN
ncbi:MAG: inorganic diphosphatase [Eubacteriales bacterium]|nr:inorganic diphosphatase [Eubacteriales bacterium]